MRDGVSRRQVRGLPEVRSAHESLVTRSVVPVLTGWTPLALSIRFSDPPESMKLSAERASPGVRMPEMSRREKFFVNRFSGWSHRRLIRWLRENLVLGPGAACLELGCGNGEVAAGIVQAFSPGRYIATDYDREQIEMAGQTLARRFPEGIPRGLELRTADALRLDFSGESFDAVFAFAMLHHVGPTHGDVKGMMDALTECDRVLRPHGQFVYRDFMNTAKIRAWLASHGYRIEAARRRLRWDQVIARKPARPGASALPDAGQESINSDDGLRGKDTS